MIFTQKLPLAIREKTCLDHVHQLRKIVHVLLEEPQSSVFAKLIQLIILMAIILSFFQILFDSLYDDADYQEISFYIEVCVFSIFSIEFLLRVTTYSAYGDELRFFLCQPLNLVDAISIALGLISLTLGRSALNALRFLKLFKSVRVIKLNRYIKGIDILQQSAAHSFRQFYYLIVGFLIICVAYGVALYYCEKSEQIEISMGDTIWLGVVTMTSVGYGDIVPRSILGCILTSMIALVGNTVILALPIAILDMDFQETYDKVQEDKKINQLKFHRKVGQRRTSIRNNEYRFFNQRLEMIESRNKEIQELLDQSNLMAKELTHDLKRLFESISAARGDDDQYHSPEKKSKSTTQLLMMKTKLYEKLVKAKRKIQITNIFRNINEESQRHIKVRQQAQQPHQTKARIKSHSMENENQLLRLRNEEYGELPFDFLNDVILQIQNEIVTVEAQERKKSTNYYFNGSEPYMRQPSFGNQSLCFLDTPGQRCQNFTGHLQPSIRVSDYNSYYERKSLLANKGQPTITNLNETGYRSATEHSSVKKQRHFHRKQIEEFKEKKKPRTPHQFFHYANDLGELDRGELLKPKSAKRFALYLNDIDISPSRISRRTRPQIPDYRDYREPSFRNDISEQNSVDLSYE